MSRFSVTADDNFQFLNDFYLQPPGAASLYVSAFQAFGDHPLQRNFRDLLEQLLALANDVVGVSDVFGRLEYSFQRGLTIDQFAENYERILSTLKEQTQAQIVVTNIPDISSAPVIASAMRDQYHRQIVEFNQRLEEIAGRHGVTVFDIYSITSRELPSHPEYFSRDGFHPSDQGYELWAVEMWPTIARVIGAAA